MNDELIKSMLNAVWNYVADDAQSACQEAGVKFTNAAAYETILDASRLETAARTDEQKAALAEFRKLSWETQVRKTRKLMGRLV